MAADTYIMSRVLEMGVDTLNIIPSGSGNYEISLVNGFTRPLYISR